jgi:D-lactate dehydrogenase
MKIICYSVQEFEKNSLAALSADSLEILLTPERCTFESLSLAQEFNAVCIFVHDTLTAAMMEKIAAYNIHYVITRSVGYDNIDLEAARRFGIRVSYIPDYSTCTVAEHTLALLLSLSRKLRLTAQLREHQDFRLNQVVGFDIAGKTVGIIGAGRIGRLFAAMVHACGARVIAYDLKPAASTDTINFVGLEELLAQSDIISLHCLLDTCSYHLLNAERIAATKRGVIIVNTARGGVIDTHALVDALESGHVGGAGLDVYEFESVYFLKDLTNKIINDDLLARLSALPQVIMTSHQAFLSAESVQRNARTLAYIAHEWETRGESPYDLC